MPLKPSFLVWTLFAVSMSEIEISTPMPANILRQKLAVSSEVFLSFVCKNPGYYCTGSYKPRCCLLPEQCCWHETQMHSVSLLVFFFNSSIELNIFFIRRCRRYWCSFCVRGHFFNYLVFEILKSFDSFLISSDLTTWQSPFVVIANLVKLHPVTMGILQGLIAKGFYKRRSI